MLSDSDSDSDYDGGDGSGGGRSSSVGRCLASIGVDTSRDLGACSSLTEEFTAIKRAYFRKILVVHPDKGGDAAEFREVNAAWELIRKLYEDRAVGSFADAAAAPAQDRYDYDYSGKASGSGRGGGGGASGGSGWASSSPRTHMPWQYYYDAAAEEVPPYKVELARSGRSKCNATRAARKCSLEDPLIGKGEIRIGSLDAQAGTYSRWIHLECWRVPSRIWLGLAREDGAGGADTGSLEECIAALSSMNEVQFTGFNDLSERDQREVASHAMKKANWARRQGRRAVTTTSRGGAGAGSQSQSQSYAAAAGGAGASSAGGSPAGNGRSGSGGGYESDVSSMVPISGNAQSLVGRGGATSTALVAPPAARSGFYVIPRPGVNGAPRDFLKGKTIVMTGVFPEIGGGAGLNLGKDRLRSMCESFGARVTSSISGKTDMLIVGKEPGASKVSKASSSAKCQLVSLADLTLSIQGEQRLEAAAPPEIESFSAGYSGNSILNKLENGGARRLLEAARAPKPPGGEESGRTGQPGPKAARKKRAPAAAKKKKPAAAAAPKKKRAPAAKAKPEPKAKKSAAATKTAAGAKNTAAGAKRAAGGARKTATGSKRKKREEGAAATGAAAKARKGKGRATKKAEENALALAP